MSDERRQQAVDHLASLVAGPRVRDSTIDAILALRDAGHGTFVLRVPRASGKPIDGSLIMGGLQLRLFEDREIG